MRRNKIINPRQVAETEMKHKYLSSRTMKCIGVIVLLVAIVYLILPFDYDETLKGRVDDFMFFMSAFCFMYAQFMNINNVRAIVLLKFISAVFCLLGAIWLLALFFIS